MEPTQFSNVKPAPSMFAQVPTGMFGRSAAPTLPTVGGYTDTDLERMSFALMQSGGDPAMLARIHEVIARHRGGAPPLMLRPTPRKAKRVTAPQPSVSYNPFKVISDALVRPQ